MTVSSIQWRDGPSPLTGQALAGPERWHKRSWKRQTSWIERSLDHKIEKAKSVYSYNSWVRDVQCVWKENNESVQQKRKVVTVMKRETLKNSMWHLWRYSVHLITCFKMEMIEWRSDQTHTVIVWKCNGVRSWRNSKYQQWCIYIFLFVVFAICSLFPSSRGYCTTN